MKRRSWRRPFFLEGNETLAYRRLRQQGQLSADFVEYYTFDARHNKSYLPETVRRQITPKVEMCGPIHRGPRAAQMAGPYVPRDWSGVLPGDYFSADDVTWNSYFWFEDEEGQFHCERGECLLKTDLRTGYPLDFILIAGKYNSRHIRKLWNRVHDVHGLPHIGAYYERGVWKSRMIVGDKRKMDWLRWEETDSGLRERGVDLQVRHATTPRAKPIEGLFKIIQDKQRSEPGYVSGNERLRTMERMKEFIGRVRRGKEHPGNEMLEMSEWAKRISLVLEEFAHDPQNGKMLPGCSPFEMWSDGLSQKPLRKLPDDARYLLATHKKIITVKQEGIILEMKKGSPMQYCNAATSKLIGQSVLAFYSLDFPELLTVSDLKRKNYFSVKGIVRPAMGATAQQLREAQAAVRGHMQEARTLYGSIHHRHIQTVIHDTRYDEQTKELGRFHNEEVAKLSSEKNAISRALNLAQAAAPGVELPKAASRNAEAAAAAAELADIIRQTNRESSSIPT